MSYAWLNFILVLLTSVASAEVHPDGQENAVWARSSYFRGFDATTGEKLTDHLLDEFALRLKQSGIRFAYVFSGPFQDDGHLPRFAFSERARESIQYLKKKYPELKILPWIGGVENKTVHLDNPKWVQNSIQDTVRLAKAMAIDGIHIDLEYVLFPASKKNSAINQQLYRKNWVHFHKLLRKALPQTFLSTVAIATSQTTLPWKLKHTLSEITDVSREVNQVSFMFYETHIHDLKLYRQGLREQLQDIKALKNKLGRQSPRFLMGIGAFKNSGPLRKYRDMRIENLPTTLKVLTELTNEFSAPLVDGLAIYSEWLASPDEWTQISQYWVNSSSPNQK
jgi:hypothetical protein